MSNFIERPRHTCALGGAIATAGALPRTIPILHAPPGCSGNTAWTQAGGCGLQVGGRCGGLSIPGSNVQEREVVFGGGDRLEQQITNTLKVMDGDLYFVLTSCVTEVIGDDIGAAVSPFRDQGIDIIFAETGGFRGNSYWGYDLVLESVLRNFAAKPSKKIQGFVNLWGITPYFDVFWRGNLSNLRELLTKLGLTVNTFFTVDDTLDVIRQANNAELNIIVSDTYGLQSAQTAQEEYGVPFVQLPLPVGPSASNEFLRTIGRLLELDEKLVEEIIAQENRRYYSILEPLTDCFNDADLQRYAAVVGDANYAPALARFLADDLGWLPEVVTVTDDLADEQRRQITNRFSRLESGLTPALIFASDTTEIRRQILEYWAAHQATSGKYSNPLTPAFVIGSSLDRPVAQELGSAHLSVSFPVSNRAILDRGYTGYSGGLRLIEDLIGNIVAGR